MSELKPCPFCGSTDIGYSIKSTGPRGTRYHVAMYCKKCNCYGARTLSDVMGEGYSGRMAAENSASLLQFAKAAWNRRAQPANEPMPTIDAVEVVRCRDCVHFGECLVTENDYCSKGERKETD